MVVINPLHAVSMLPPLPSRWLSHHGKGNNYQQCDSTHADTHTQKHEEWLEEKRMFKALDSSVPYKLGAHLLNLISFRHQKYLRLEKNIFNAHFTKIHYMCMCTQPLDVISIQYVLLSYH